MRFFFVSFLAAALVACSPSSDTIEPEPDQKDLGRQGSTAVSVPLIWQASGEWTVAPLFGAAERASACGDPEPELHSLGIEIDAATLPHKATVASAMLVIDPCDARGAWLPDNRPVFALFSVDRFGVATQTASAAQDQSPDVASYSLPHEIVMPMDPPVQADREKDRYMILFEPEHGDEATGGTRVTGLVLDLLVP